MTKMEKTYWISNILHVADGAPMDNVVCAFVFLRDFTFDIDDFSKRYFHC